MHPKNRSKVPYLLAWWIFFAVEKMSIGDGFLFATFWDPPNVLPGF